MIHSSRPLFARLSNAARIDGLSRNFASNHSPCNGRLRAAAHFEEEIALICVLKAQLVSSLRERLTRETRGQDVVIGHVESYDFVAALLVKVTPRVDTEVDLVESLQFGLPLCGEHTPPIQLIEGDMEATQPIEEVDETEGLFAGSHYFSPVHLCLIGRDFS
jgi:hypothetical protein